MERGDGGVGERGGCSRKNDGDRDLDKRFLGKRKYRIRQFRVVEGFCRWKC